MLYALIGGNMPELPEVETIARELRIEGIIGSKVRAMEIDWPKTLTPIPPILGKAIIGINRRGKYLILEFESGKLFFHLRMTGRLLIVSKSARKVEYERVRFILSDDRTLIFADPRKFGRITWGKELNHIGPDAFLDPLPPTLLENKQRMIKTILLDQSVLAGLGNIYVDEVLFRAKIHPEKSMLASIEAQRIVEIIPQVLTIAIQNGGTSIGEGKGNYYNLQGKRGGMRQHLQVYKRRGAPCISCGTIIERIIVAGRGTHYCPNCQANF